MKVDTAKSDSQTLGQDHGGRRFWYVKHEQTMGMK